jgi:N-acyl-D-aspartate/D-glutamate deacylase
MMNERAHSDEAGVLARVASWGGYRIGDTFSSENEGLRGRVVRDIAAERQASSFDTLLDIVIADQLRTVLWPLPPDDDGASWDLRAKVWASPHAMLGGSDAGAHLDRMCGAPYTTAFLADVIRGRRLVSLERAVQMMTDAPARLFGLKARGLLREGWHADLVLFDPETIGAEDMAMVRDLPGGSARLFAGARGIVRVLVNGVPTVVDGEATGDLPGSLLRSGRDTETVAVPAAG